MPASLRPIDRADLNAVGKFLHRHLNAHIPTEIYTEAFKYNWPARKPNFGFMLEDKGRIVGVLGAVYSTRIIQGIQQDFCNLSCWCVLPAYRNQSLSLIIALIKQPDFTFVNILIVPAVVEIHRALGFKIVEGSQNYYLCPNLPYRFSARVPQISTAATIDLQKLNSTQRYDLSNLRDLSHVNLAFVECDGKIYMITYRRKPYRVIRNLYFPAVEVLHIDRRPCPLVVFCALSHWLLIHHQIPFTLVARNFISQRPFGAIAVRGKLKMFLSKTLSSMDIDNLYTELVLGLG